ncbi:MAG: hypothetical protein CL529_03640 [Aequorivita sp.]|nr:hypothetical protein [Aequorivita sp.]|tara:strand:- start:284493 stop:285254 length:762 start_codon:yes stop_codon:yes gene_type:complete
MLRFFRRIRQNLLAEKKFTKYLFYALGEIILVVIGILIALAINNANQKRLTEKNEVTYLMGLKEEFQTSKLKLKELIAVNQDNYNGAKQILAYTGDPSAAPSEEEFSKVLYSTFSTDIAFNPNNSLLQEIINSGNLKNLSNPELRIQLTNWISTIEDIRRQEEELGIQRIKVLDMFRTNDYSLRTIFEKAGVSESIGLPSTDVPESNLNLLDSKEFENNVLMFIITSYATEEVHYRPLMQDLDKILKLIDGTK